jgi:hypothetical protein
VNPADTEEAIWAFLAEAKLLGAGRARQQFLQVSHSWAPFLLWHCHMHALHVCMLSIDKQQA